MQLNQGACGYEVAGRIQEHGIKWQTTRNQVNQRATFEPLTANTKVLPAPQQIPPEKPEM